MKYARIENSKVMETVPFDATGLFHKDFKWVPCPEDVDQGWTYDGTGFLPGEVPPPPEPDPSQVYYAYTAKVIEFRDGAEKILAPFAMEYGAIEMSSWTVQLEEARAFQSNPSAPTPWLDSASATRGMSKAEFAARIIGNATAWAALQGYVNGQRLAYQDQLDAIKDGDGTDQEKLEAIQALTVQYSLPGA